MRRLGGAAAVMVLAVACSDGAEDPLRRAAGGADVTIVMRQEGARVGAYRDSVGRSCFVYVGTRTSGGRCMAAVGTPQRPGWAVEITPADVGPTQVLLVAADPRAATVRVPKHSGGHVTVYPSPVEGLDAHMAAVPVDLADLRFTGNTAEAYDAQGRLLGRTHDCEGAGGPPDCGPWTGLIDERLPRPTATP